MRQWLCPLRKFRLFDHTQETADHLLNEIKSQLNESNTAGELSPSLVTLLRAVQHACIPPEHQFTPGAKIELKYDYMLLKFFSNGIYALLTAILEVGVGCCLVQE